MGFLNKLWQLPAKLAGQHKPPVRRTSAKGKGLRACRIEEMEQRRLLAADIQLGLVYYEDSGGFDEVGDRFELTWQGGADGTQLTQIVIDTDKEGNGLTNGDVFFDTVAGGRGVYGAFPFQLESHDGFQITGVEVQDDGMTLVINFSGFDAGERLIFSIDVDEQAFLKANAVAEGAEFEGSILTASFAAPHYYGAVGTDIFLDDYDPKLAQSGLDLPPDSYQPPNTEPTPVRTAAAIMTIEQEPLPISISGVVYEDVDLDNTQDPGDLGIAGVTLTLFRLEGTQYVSTGQTAVTDAAGAYRFDDVAPGTYRVVETQPAAYFSVGATPGKVDGAVRGVVTSVDVLSDITLLGGEDSVRNDFAEARPASLSGQVYHDVDNDGFMQATEPGIGGVTIEVYRVVSSGPQPPPIIVQTDAGGFWSVDGLQPGEYRIVEVHPSGWLDGRDIAGTAGGTAINPGDEIVGVTLLSGQAGENYKFGELLPNSIRGRVHADRDGDCELDPDETPLAGVVIHLLDGAGQIIDTTTTNAQGEYEFTGLPPGTYGVLEVQPDGYFDGDDHVGSLGGTLVGPDSITGVVLVSDQHGVEYNFCEHEGVSLAGNVYADDDNDGVFDGTEVGIAGVTLELLDASGAPTGITTTTDANGAYRFDNLAPGVYGVIEVQPAGYFDGLDTAGSAGGTAHNPGDSITGAALTPGVHGVEYNFGELRPASIAGRVHADLDGDCELDPGESPLAGVVIELLNANGQVIATTTTDVNGEYQFDGLAPGVYGVHEVQPAGYFDGDEHVGSAGGILSANDTVTQVTLGPGVDAVEYNFCELEPASIAGRVHADRDGDCELDPDETPLAGVVIELLNADGQVIATTTTDVNGEYRFDNLAPGVYGVHEVQPAGYFDGDDHVGSAGGLLSANDTVTQVTLGSGVDAVEYNFCELEPASIAGRVHADRDGDCELDPDEKPLAGVVIELLNADGQVVATTTTDANGEYRFDGLAPGVYGVHEVQPAGYFDGDDHVGSAGGILSTNDTVTQVTLGPGVDAVEYNFCELEPVGISGYVYADLDNDGVFDSGSGEYGIGGVTLMLVNEAGVPTGATTVTNQAGFYSFKNLPPGVYGVMEVQPIGYFDGLDTAGSAGGAAANPGDKITGAVLTPGVLGVNYNFGELPPASISGSVHADRDGDCIVDPGEQALAGVVVELLDAEGHVIATTTTDFNGIYRFEGLAPGVYGVHEVQPAGYFDSGDHVGSAGGVLSANDTITNITLHAGQQAVHYDFCEHEPAGLSGYVYEDANNNGRFDAGENPIGGVTVILLDGDGVDLGPTAVTSASGFYQFTGLAPGNYGVREIQPAGWDDGLDAAGTAGGVAHNPGDLITGAVLTPGLHGQNYNFGELGDLVPFIMFPPQLVAPEPLQPLALYTPRVIAPITPEPYIAPRPGIPYNAGHADGYTWHLSVINAGHPRGSGRVLQNIAQLTNVSASTFILQDQGFPAPVAALHWSLWTLEEAESGEPSETRELRFGMRTGRPVTGDFNGDGITDVGVFYRGHWYIDANGNGRWDSDDLWAKLGADGDLPVTGDWDGDGKTDIGIFGRAWPGDPRAVRSEPGLPDPLNLHTGVRKNVPPPTEEAARGWRTMKRTSTGPMRADLIDHVFHYGKPGDYPIAGDWSGAGVATIGIFNAGEWILDVDGDGQKSDGDANFVFGQRGDVPVVGDFNGDGLDEIGVYRAGTWILDTDNDRELDADDMRIEMGGPDDLPAVGDWNGDGIDEPGLYNTNTDPGEPLAGS